MSGIRAILGALAAVACAAALPACGADEGGAIPADAGETLLTELDRIEDEVAQGNCDVARAAAVGFAEGVSELPPEVDGELRKALVNASTNLESLTQNPAQCTPTTGATGETGAEPPAITETPTEPAETTTDTTTDAPPTDGDEGGGGDEGEPPANGDPGNTDQGGGGEGGDDGGGSSGGIGSDG